MKISRRGTFRNHGWDKLVSAETIPSPKWDDNERHIKFYETARKGGSTYKYAVELSGEDLAQLVEIALVEAARGDRTARAQGQATATYLRSILGTPSDEM